VRSGSNSAAEKRRKEISRLKRQREKAERRQQRQAERQTHVAQDPDEDPDIAGIVPGPQPPEE
jgi:Tfp pilus assembly protein PilN